MSKYKYVLLDMDGTIVNTEPSVVHCVLHVAKTMGYDIPPVSEQKTWIGPPLTDTFIKSLKMPAEKTPEAMKIYREEYDKNAIFDCELYPGIPEAVKGLHEKGFKVSVASSKMERACDRILNHFSLREYFDDVVGSDVNCSIETKEQVLKEFFSRHNDATLENTVLVGDTYFDAEGAKLCGIDFIGVLYGFGDSESMGKYNPVVFFDNISDAVDYIYNKK
ncbi:MAG: HAD hydrolase-like protein [Lachnospiraceae bacterium]|nr:HAD hydrolase-like protein [Lachnospiraceae bacterium]